jgi:nitrogen fixation protein NifX
MAQSITREAALRVALAARELGSLSARELVSALVERLDLPLTEAKLSTVTVADLQVLLQGDDVVEPDVPKEQLKQAVRLLWGEGITNSELPAVASYSEGEMPESIRVACASNREQLLDGHYGSCERFLIYQVSPSEVRLIGVRPTLEADHADDRNVARAALIGDCQIVYVQSIGGPGNGQGGARRGAPGESLQPRQPRRDRRRDARAAAAGAAPSAALAGAHHGCRGRLADPLCRASRQLGRMIATALLEAVAARVGRGARQPAGRRPAAGFAGAVRRSAGGRLQRRRSAAARAAGFRQRPLQPLLPRCQRALRHAHRRRRGRDRTGGGTAR